MNEDIKIEIRIIHPTEGEIVKRYDLSTIENDIQSMESGMQSLAAGLAYSIPDYLRAIQCAARCKNKAGYLACVARCLADGRVCDGGTDNCD
ncbi:hypothetical protein BCS42_03405 [Crenothrix sp. D3]|nr:hypothetical protein BCS42_03405 [Crenothrix sp. D3]